MAKRQAKAVAATESPATIIAFKGFDANFQCRGFQYEVGKTYKHSGEVVRCAAGGFHSCEMPLDIFTYYESTKSRFAEVEVGGALDRGENQDSKIASAEITIRAELKLPDIIRKAVAWIVERAKENTATGDSGHAAATGYGGHAAATGYRGHAAATGDYGHAAATGDYGHAAATGGRGNAAATGYYGHATATGDYGHATTTGYGGHTAATGDYGNAAATGDRGNAAATGDRGNAAATGDRGHAAATGDYGHAAATGYRGHAAVKGKNAIAIAAGAFGVASADDGGAIMLAAYDDDWNLVTVFASKVGENGIEAGKAYHLGQDGKPVDVTEAA